MKNESDFNAFLSRGFAKYGSNRVCATKTSDRFTAGISDFLLAINGNSVALECKYIEDFGKEDKPALSKHPFTPQQVNFMRKMQTAGALCLGLILVKKLKTMFLIPYSIIEASGGNPTPAQIRKGMEFPASSKGIQPLLVALGG